MNEAKGELKDVVEHLEAKGVLTPADTKAIVHALEHLQVETPPEATQPQKALTGSYWEARHKALHDRKFHPR